MYAANILNRMLQYIREKVNENSPESIEMLFAKDKKNRVYAKVFVGDKQDKSAQIFTDTSSKADAFTLLVFLEQYFRRAGYDILSEVSVLQHECFSVIITF